LSEADLQPEYATGKGVLHEHLDIYGRPVVIIRAARHRIGAVSGPLRATAFPETPPFDFYLVPGRKNGEENSLL
jgi:hypothetical protein